MTSRRRLDAEMVRRGLAESRAEAQAAIRDGKVSVLGRAEVKSATLVSANEPVTVKGAARPFVSRGGEKLAAALQRFGVDPAGRSCLDAGASAGGFTDCLLKRGAARVAAVDVGYGQLAWALRQDPRVIVLERANVRDLEPDDLPFAPDLVAADLSFISLRVALPALARVAATPATFVLLVKPQFEAGRAQVGKGGVVRDPAVWRQVLDQVVGASRNLGLEPRGAMASPLLGPAGNVEFLIHAERSSGGSSGAGLDLESAVAEGERLRSAVAS
jgi:23S rRNA (cytidine1920-2'-O)/16S rRNA (cytidine1409-2'-O)-methyltransferase